MQQFASFAQGMNEKLQQVALDDQQRNEILNKYTEMESYFSMIKTELAKKKTHEDMGISIDEVQVKVDEFKTTVNSIFSTPAKQAAPAGSE